MNGKGRHKPNAAAANTHNMENSGGSTHKKTANK